MAFKSGSFATFLILCRKLLSYTTRLQLH
jgi:hypothetical protein